MPSEGIKSGMKIENNEIEELMRSIDVVTNPRNLEFEVEHNTIS